MVKSQAVAAIDIGTNTFRLLIGEVIHDLRNDAFSINELRSERVITRLGEGIARDGFIHKQAMERSVAALISFRDILRMYSVREVAAVATSALRDAGNSEQFVEAVKGSTGLDVEIISGEEEARRTAQGMLIGLESPESALMIDIGGGSTEIIFSRQREPLSVRSLDIGVVYLTDMYMKHDPPSEDDLRSMTDLVSEKISAVSGPFRSRLGRGSVFIGTAGTVTALSAMLQKLPGYDPRKIHNTRISRKETERTFALLSTITTHERARFFPFEPARLDIIVPGTLILLRLFEAFDFHEIIVSNYGLREGVLLRLHEKLTRKT